MPHSPAMMQTARSGIQPRRVIVSVQQMYYSTGTVSPASQMKSHIPPPALSASPSPKRILQSVPLPTILRSLLILSITTLPPRLLHPIIRFTKRHAATIQSSPLLRWLTMRTFYENFCLGRDPPEIAARMHHLRAMGMSGVIVAYARESPLSRVPAGPDTLSLQDPQYRDWVQGNLDTVHRLGAGDYLAVRCTGAGAAATALMERFSSVAREVSLAEAERVCGPQLDAYTAHLDQICKAAKARGVRVLVDSETSRHQAAIDRVALSLMKSHNTNGRAYVLHTYQMYLKSALQKISSHLTHATTHNYTLGLKLVRGAYIHVEPDRSVIHATKPATDACFDEGVARLLSDAQAPWSAEVMLASHNSRSVRRALALFAQRERGHTAATGVRSVTFAQLMGMVDELSLEISHCIGRVNENRNNNGGGEGERNGQDQGKQDEFPVLGVYKYTVWGSLQECLLYLLRRAEENCDSMRRSRESAGVLLREVRDRVLRR